MARVDGVSGNTLEPVAAELAPSRCPVNHSAPPVVDDAAACPFTGGRASSRSRADQFVRRLLRIPERPAGVSVQSAHTAFQRSMAISATRCTLTYVVFPFLIPLIGFAAGVGPAIGITIGVVAIGCDVFTIRRFFAVDHRWRWQFSIVVLLVVGLLTVLLVEDIAHLA
jgi:hypothetical protein